MKTDLQRYQTNDVASDFSTFQLHLAHIHFILSNACYVRIIQLTNFERSVPPTSNNASSFLHIHKRESISKTSHHVSAVGVITGFTENIIKSLKQSIMISLGVSSSNQSTAIKNSKSYSQTEVLLLGLSFNSSLSLVILT